MPSVNSDIKVDGIVVASSGPAPLNCPPSGPDTGWGGVVGHEFKPPIGSTATPKGHLFPAVRMSGGRVQKLHIGVHVESVPDFTTSDRLALYFQTDGNKANWDPANDFALVFDGLGNSPATPVGRDGCTTPGNQPRFYKRNAANTAWDAQAVFPGGIAFKTSFDYETVRDPETEMWTLEVAIDLSILNPGLQIAQGGKVGVGGKLYLFETGVNKVVPLYFPQAVAPSDPFLDAHPNQGGVSPATLEKLTIGCSLDVVFTTVRHLSGKGAPDKFTFLQFPSDFDAAEKVLPDRQGTLSATIRYVNMANPNEVGRLAMPNSGQVAFRFTGFIKPGASDFSIPVKTFDQSVRQLGQSVATTFRWPTNRTEFLSVQGFFSFSDRRELVVELSGFNIDAGGNNQVIRPIHEFDSFP
jgi:hypothetical protein